MPRHRLLCYFVGVLSGPGSLTHPPVVPLRISQMQAPLQCTVVLHVPLQTGSRLVGDRSCRAETVPAQRTAMATAARNVFLIVLLMICPSLQLQRPDKCAAAFSYFSTDVPGMGYDEQNGVPVSMGKMQRQPLLQGLPTPQLPPHVAEPFASLRNCRAETVPAQRTPMTSAEKNIDLNFFMIASSLFQDRKRHRTGRRQAILSAWRQ
jgi:hypothetical protein